MRVSHRHPIHVQSETDGRSWAGLTSILECLLPVKFGFTDNGETEAVAGIIVEGTRAGKQRVDHAAVSTLTIPECRPAAASNKPVEITVKFADDPEVPFPFRGESLRAKVAVEGQVLSLTGRERVLASTESGPVWAVGTEGDTRHFKSGFACPHIPAEENLAEVLNGERFLEILPLLHWIREISAGNKYENPPLRASFIFDDPNLHWPSYGYIDFRRIAIQAARENYHVAIATIPLDTWFTHAATAQVFRKNARHLSLAIHGNNHLKQELARDYTPSARVSLLRQAVHRIERLENKVGLQVCRVMIPPHGACSEEMLEELPKCGFEAACISHGSLRAHNRDRLWTRNLGYPPSELVQGCPILPRWGMAGNVTNTILLAAFLGQPILLRGHHQDLKNGMELLDHLAGFINRLGPVSWPNMTGLCRMNYQWRMDGRTCRVKPLGGKITVRVPDQAVQLVIEDTEGGFDAGWQITGLNNAVQTVRAGECISLTDTLRGEISMAAIHAPAAPQLNGVNRMGEAALFRRLLTEGRDRFLV
jgi:hypothetical protein